MSNLDLISGTVDAAASLKFNDRVTGWITKRSDVATHVSLKDEDLKRKYLGGGVIFYRPGSEVHELCKQLDKKKLHTFLYQWENEKSDSNKKQIILALETAPGSPPPYEHASVGARSISFSRASSASIGSLSAGGLGSEDSSTRPAAISSTRSTPVAALTATSTSASGPVVLPPNIPSGSVWSRVTEHPAVTSAVGWSGKVEAGAPWRVSDHPATSSDNGSALGSSSILPPSAQSKAANGSWGARTAGKTAWPADMTSSNTSQALMMTAPQKPATAWTFPPKGIPANMAHIAKYFSPYYETRLDVVSDPNEGRVLPFGRLSKMCHVSESSTLQLISLVQPVADAKKFMREPRWTRKRMEQYLELVWVRAIEQRKVFFFADTADQGDFSLDSIALSSVAILKKYGVTREFVLFDSGLVGSVNGSEIGPLFCLLVAHKTLMQLSSASSLTPRSATGSVAWGQQPTLPTTGGDLGPPPYILLGSGVLHASHPVVRLLYEAEKIAPNLKLLGGSEEALQRRETRPVFLVGGNVPPLNVPDNVEYELEELVEESLGLLIQTGVVDSDEVSTSSRGLDVDSMDNGSFLDSRFKRGAAGRISLYSQLGDAIKDSLAFAKANIASVPVLHYYCALDPEVGSIRGRLNWSIPFLCQLQPDGIETRLALSLDCFAENEFRVCAILSLEQVYVGARVLGIPQAAWLLTGVEGGNSSMTAVALGASSSGGVGYRSKKSSSIDHGALGDDVSTVASRN